MSQQIKRIGVLSYARCRDILRSKDRVLLGPNTYLSRSVESVGNVADVVYKVTFHTTDIITYYRDGRIIVDCAGHRTVPTKQRLNAILPGSVYQERHVWYVSLNGEKVKYFDGINVGAQTEEELLYYASKNGDPLAQAMWHDRQEEGR